MKKRWTIFLLIFYMVIFGLTVQRAFADDNFPLRKKYPDVKIITTKELAVEYNDVIIIDARSGFEFDVIHMTKAFHVPVAKATFVKNVEAIRGKTGRRKIVFYCNGHTCAKSYKATKRAMEAGFKNVYAYDAGIFDWVEAHPDRGMLFGKTPVDLKKIISKSALEAKMLSYKEFKSRAENPDAVVVDVRDPMQRKNIPDLPNIRNIPLDRLSGLLKRGQFKSKELLLFDAVGKQVKWLQYYLENKGYSNYHFLKKGVLSTE